MQIDNGLSSLRWSYEFDSPSEHMAKEYAYRNIKSDKLLVPGVTVNLFNVKADVLVASFEIEKAVVEGGHIRPHRQGEVG